MNWGGFPVAFRFPVQDFTEETRRRCWSYALPALAYADLSENTTLLEAESTELFDPEQLIYMTVIAPTAIPPSRKNSLLWRRDGRLMSALTLYVPAVQENYLELFAKCRLAASIGPDRAVRAEAGFENLLPQRIEKREKAPVHTRALILPKGELPYPAREALCRETMKVLYEGDEGLYLKMLPMSEGGEGAAYTAAAFRHGRLFSQMIPDRDGQKHRVLFAVLPGRQLLIDGFTVPNIADPLSEEYGLGRAILEAKGRGFAGVRLAAKGLAAPASEARAMEDADELYALSRELPLYDKVILTEYDADGRIRTESIDIDRRDKACVSSILSRRSATVKS